MIRVLPVVNGVATADFIGGNNSFKVFLSSDITFTFANARQAQVAFVLFQQDSVGGHAITFAPNIKNVQYTESGVNQTASIRFQYDETTNSWYATAATSTISQPSNILYVDGTRTDVYTPNGTVGLPFKKIMDAVNQVIANGDNSFTNQNVQVPYLIDIIGPTQYAETIDLSDPHVVNIYFEGHNAVTVFGLGGTLGNPAIKAVGNPGLQVANFANMAIWGGITASSAKAIDFEDNSASGTFLAHGAIFTNCTLHSSVADGILFKNVISGELYLCTSETPDNWTVDGSSVTLNSSNIFPAGTLAAKNAATLVGLESNVYPNITIDATSSVTVEGGGFVGWPGNPITVNGTLVTSDATILGNVTVNNGGVAHVTGQRVGTLTVNAGGSYTPRNIWEMAELILPNGQLIITGTGSPEAAQTAPVGSLYLRTDGGANTTLYVKESGTGNTGWAAK